MQPDLVAVVSHTHWDREWYHAAERFRQLLVPLIDELLDAPDGASFLLDGQTVVLEDYLAIRPERASELSASLRDGKLEAGPWFVLPDELIPGGEGLVRNLLAGARTLRDLRAESPPVLYCPDSFGHPAALPDIAAGFGKVLVIIWRGCRSESDAFNWRGRDSRVLTYHLSRSGYELGSNLPPDAGDAAARWPRISAELLGRSSTGMALLLNGADHHARQRDLAKALKELSWAAGGLKVEQTSLSKFARELARRAASSKLSETSGEMRDSYGYTWTLQGTLATRAHQKRRYALVERTLVRDVEPWAALARMIRGASRQHLTRAAWRDVLLCQPHDTLCGCSIDAVARAMDVRLESAEAQAAGLREDALLDLAHHDRDAARVAVEDQHPVLVIRNPSARARAGVAEVTVDMKVVDAGVGPGSAPPGVEMPYRPLNPDGMPMQEIEVGALHARTEAPRAYPDNDLILRRHALVWSSEIPGYGIAYQPLVDGATAASVPSPVFVEGKRMSNGILSLAWTPTGQLTLRDESSKRAVRGLLSWESREDQGDLYTPSLRKAKLKAKCVGTKLVHRGPLRADLAQVWRFSGAKERVDLRVTFSLDAGSQLLRISVEGENSAKDHRLRILIATDVKRGVTTADAAFGVVERQTVSETPERGAMEHPIASAPLHRYVSRFDNARGATLFSDGLAEYEANGRGFAVTLVRSVGHLARADLPERPGHAGWPEPTPLAQCEGPFRARFALALHGALSDDTIDAIERLADDALSPLTGETLRSALRVPPTFAGVTLEGSGLAFSAFKESEAGDWAVARCTNLLDREVNGRWRFGFALKEAKTSRLDEMPLEKLVVANNAVAFRAPPRGIVTILVR